MKKALLVAALIGIILFSCNDEGYDEVNPNREDSLAKIDTTTVNKDSLP